MAYEDTIRVADLKVRKTRTARVIGEVGLRDGQLMRVTEYMHPRLQEVCETLPRGLGAAISGSPRLRRLLEPLFRKGRHVETTSLRWFLVLRLLASLRSIRRSSLRYTEEQKRIEDWLGVVTEIAPEDPNLGAEIVETQELIKGYSDTFERGLKNFHSVVTAAQKLAGRSDAAAQVRSLRLAALADEHGHALAEALASTA